MAYKGQSNFGKNTIFYIPIGPAKLYLGLFNRPIHQFKKPIRSEQFRKACQSSMCHVHSFIFKTDSLLSVVGFHNSSFFYLGTTIELKRHMDGCIRLATCVSAFLVFSQAVSSKWPEWWTNKPLGIFSWSFYAAHCTQLSSLTHHYYHTFKSWC